MTNRPEEMYFLINMRTFLGNSPMMWRKNGAGYTQWLDDAEQMTAEEADKIIKSTSGSHEFRRVKVSVMYDVARLTVDMQDLHRTEAFGEGRS
jgi:hypothetical protein